MVHHPGSFPGQAQRGAAASVVIHFPHPEPCQTTWGSSTCHASAIYTVSQNLGQTKLIGDVTPCTCTNSPLAKVIWDFQKAANFKTGRSWVGGLAALRLVLLQGPSESQSSRIPKKIVYARDAAALCNFVYRQSMLEQRSSICLVAPFMQQAYSIFACAFA